MEDGLWLSCQDLVSDGAWLGQVIEGTGRAIGTEDPGAAASIFVQGYAYRLAVLAVACLTVGGVVPGAEPGAMAVGLGRVVSPRWRTSNRRCSTSSTGALRPRRWTTPPSPTGPSRWSSIRWSNSTFAP